MQLRLVVVVNSRLAPHIDVLAHVKVLGFRTKPTVLVFVNGAMLRLKLGEARDLCIL